jgi:polar amino acid transport system substrate-binding protein
MFNDIRTVMMPLLVVLLLVCGPRAALAGGGAGEGTTPDSAKPEIVFAIGEWPPLVSEKLPQYGPYVRRVAEVFEALGYEVHFEFMPWKRAYEMTQNGTYQATFPWIKTEQRVKEMLYPVHPIAWSRQMAFYRKSAFPLGLELHSLADIAERDLHPVGVASYWYEDAYHELGISATLVSKASVAWRFLNAGRADVMVEEENVAPHDIARTLGPEALEKFGATGPVKSDQMFILFSPNRAQSRDLIRKFDIYMDSRAGRTACARWGVCVDTVPGN